MIFIYVKSRMALPGDFSKVMALWLTFFGITVMIIMVMNFTCFPHMVIKFNIFEVGDLNVSLCNACFKKPEVNMLKKYKIL